MNKIINFFKLVRIQNLIILILAQYMFYYFVYENFGDIKLYLLLLITFLITASGYIINDIFDVESDEINKPEVIIGNHIPARIAIFWYYSLNIISVLLSCYLFYLLKNLYCDIILFLIILSSIFILRWYSKVYKHRFIIGNFIIATLTSLSVFNVLLLGCIEPSYFSQFNYYILFIVFSFLLTFAREIVKDLEDIEGDKIMDSRNIASSLTLIHTKFIIVIILLSIFIIFIFWSSFFNYNETVTIYNIFINLMIVFSIYKVVLSQNKNDFTFISSLLKIIMILGILFIPISYL